MSITNFPVVYIFREIGRDDIAKIGKCVKSGYGRFQQAYCVNPRGVDVVAMWKFDDKKTMDEAERAGHRGLSRLPDADGREWFMIPPNDALHHLSALFGEPAFLSHNLPFDPGKMYEGEPYDMLRERSDRYKGRLVQRRIWIHEETGSNGCAKISHNTWWCEPGSRSTNAKSLTYNTRKTVPTKCMAFPISEDDPTWEAQVRETNDQVLKIWEELVTCHNISGPPAIQCGWTTASVGEIVSMAISRGMVSLEIDPASPPRGIKSVKYKDR
jgi:hypothetical protein